MLKSYKLSDPIVSGDVISSNIYKRRSKIYYNIKNFNSQKTNDGIFAENILRLVLDGVNLNHLSKNHPHVDIAIVNPIEGFTKKNEIISVKSSINKKPSLAKLISDTKSIKLESMFSYILFANSNYELNYDRAYFNARTLLNKSIEFFNIELKAKKSDKSDYKAVVNLVAYYLMFKNKEKSGDKKTQDLLNQDLSKIAENDYNLEFGSYSSYRVAVLRRLVNLDSPISLGGIYLTDSNNLTCVIKKTNTIKLNKYWESLVNIWLDEDFFDSESPKYLRLPQVKKLFGISESDDFPITIEISIADYLPVDANIGLTDQQRIDASKVKSQKRTNKLYIATKFKDADFGDKEGDVNDFFAKSIDVLEDDPNVITKFTKFLNFVQNPPVLNKWW